MKIVVACCGLFHFRNYILKLEERGRLLQFIYAHKVSGELRGPLYVNIYVKEYAIRLIQKLFSERVQTVLFPFFHDLWDIIAARRLVKGDVLHVMLHGTSLRLIKRARQLGMTVLGEVVNSHPRNYHSVIAQQSKLCGVWSPETMSKQLIRLELELALCDKILAPSQYVCDSLVAHGVSRNKIKIVPYGANTDYFYPIKRPLGVPRVGVICVAQVIPRKGIHVLLKAWKRRSNPGLSSLTIVGRIPAEMQHLLSDAGDVVFTGPMPRAEVRRLLQEAHIFVLPTFEEGFAVSILEAMACGCAVVATSASGADMVIQSGSNGMIVEAGDEAALAESIDRLVAEPVFRSELSLKSLATVSQSANWDHYVSAVERVYAEICPTPKIN